MSINPLFQGLGEAKMGPTRLPRLPIGRGTYTIVKIQSIQTRGYGLCLVVDLADKDGELFGWFQSTMKEPDMALANMKKFFVAAAGIDPSDNKAVAEVSENLAAIATASVAEGIFDGRKIECNVVSQNSKKVNPETGKPYSYAVCNWAPSEQ